MNEADSDSPKKPNRQVGWLLAALLLAIAAWFFVQSTYACLRIALAREQTAIFEEMLNQAAKTTNPQKMAGCLEYTLAYYPSGTKQATGSPLDEVVERCRAMTVLGIIEQLRHATGEDLGDDPQEWIGRYAEPVP